MRIVIDMNLSPEWKELLESHGYEAQHWMDIGSPRAPDDEILMHCALTNSVVLTADLDFGEILARTGRRSPSVVILRAANCLPSTSGGPVLTALSALLSQTDGFLAIVEPRRARVRLLPLGENSS